jgi:hypothetical protein
MPSGWTSSMKDPIQRVRDYHEGLVRDLVHNQRSHEEAWVRAKLRVPDAGPVRVCCQCGGPTRFRMTNPTLTTLDWCEPCYLVAIDQEGQRSRFLGQKTGLARHLARSPKRKPADDFERSQYGLD